MGQTPSAPSERVDANTTSQPSSRNPSTHDIVFGLEGSPRNSIFIFDEASSIMGLNKPRCSRFSSRVRLIPDRIFSAQAQLEN
jgi:hypothetical protein